MWLGAHISISKGLANAVQTALEMQGNTFQFFSRNPRGGKARELDTADIKKAYQLMEKGNFGKLVAHAPYVYNLASVKENVRRFSLLTLRDDLIRIKEMGVPYLVVHVGSHGGQGEEKGLELVMEGLKSVLKEIPEETQILLEGMAGQGTELGYTLEQLAQILQGCDYHPGLGVCLDSCHLTGAGYDLAHFTKFKEQVEKSLGWDKVKVFHLNDSLFPLNSRRDRHAKLGEGYLGLETLKKIVSDKAMEQVILILETPNDNLGYAQEIALVREMRKRR